MIGVPIEGAALFFCDNESVYSNASFSKSQLNKKHQDICFHQSRECMAPNIIIVHKVNNNDNISDMLIKSLPGWKHVKLISLIVYSENPNIS